MKKVMVTVVCCVMILCSGCSAFAESIQSMSHDKKSSSNLMNLISGDSQEVATEAATAAATQPTTQPTQETTAPTVEHTEPVAQSPMETIPVVTRPTEPVQQSAPSYGGGYNSSSYLQKIYLGQSIYSGPGYNYSYVRGVEETNNYTIVDERYDASGRLWGKLKSGIGWVDLTDIRGGGYDYDYDYDYSWGYGQYYSVNYVTKIKDASCPIYSSPSYYGSYVGTVQEAGSYTIVKETYDEYGRLWGKLKSGLGWVCLSDYT